MNRVSLQPSDWIRPDLREKSSARIGSLSARVLALHLTWQERILLPVTSKLLMSLMAILLALMPWMEAKCDWDHFLTTGHDFELGLFCFFAAIALAVLLARSLRVLPVILGALVRPAPALANARLTFFCASGEITGRAFPVPLRI